MWLTDIAILEFLSSMSREISYKNIQYRKMNNHSPLSIVSFLWKHLASFVLLIEKMDGKNFKHFLYKSNEFILNSIELFAFDHPLMKTVYAIVYDASQRKIDSKIFIVIEDFVLYRSSLWCQWKKR